MISLGEQHGDKVINYMGIMTWWLVLSDECMRQGVTMTTWCVCDKRLDVYVWSAMSGEWQLNNEVWLVIRGWWAVRLVNDSLISEA